MSTCAGAQSGRCVHVRAASGGFYALKSELRRVRCTFPRVPRGLRWRRERKRGLRKRYWSFSCMPRRLQLWTVPAHKRYISCRQVLQRPWLSIVKPCSTPQGQNIPARPALTLNPSLQRADKSTAFVCPLNSNGRRQLGRCHGLLMHANMLAVPEFTKRPNKESVA